MAQFDNIMNMSMTRSIYIGTDKTAEVLKRKEAAEKELMAKREAKMKEQADRLERAKNQKENELRERIRMRQQRELERQKAALDRRCEQLNKLNAKKEEILQKNHQKSSRVVAMRPQKKLAFAFGSSTPRELCFLEKGQKRSNQALSSNSRGSTPPHQNLQSEPATSRVPSRFMTTKNRVERPPIHSSSNGMTRSVFGSLSSSASTTNKQQPPTSSPRRKPSTVKKQQARSPLSSTNSSKNNSNASSSLMTQSLYAAGQNGFSKGLSNVKSPEKMVNNKKTDIDVLQQRRPVIRRKVEDHAAKILKSPSFGTSATILTNIQQPILNFNVSMDKPVEENIDNEINKVPEINKSSVPNNFDENKFDDKMDSSNSIVVDQEQVPNLHVSPDDFDDKTFIKPSDEDNPYLSLHEQLQEHKEREGGNDCESILSDRTLVLSRVDRDSISVIDTTDATLVQPPENLMNTTSLDESEVTSTITNNKPPTVDRTIPPISIPPILEEKRKQRLAQVNEILQKIRPENGSSPIITNTNNTATIQHSNSNGLLATKNDVSTMDNNTIPTNNIAVANPLMSKTDKSIALADFLQQRRRMMKETNGMSNGQQQQQLPGQVVATIVPPNNNNNPLVNTIFHSEEKINKKNDNKHYTTTNYNTTTIRTPPDDPHMNNNNGNEEEEHHPQEPTNFINF